MVTSDGFLRYKKKPDAYVRYHGICSMRFRWVDGARWWSRNRPRTKEIDLVKVQTCDFGLGDTMMLMRACGFGIFHISPTSRW